MLIVGDILIGSGDRQFFDHQITFLYELSKTHDKILFLGNIFKDKRKVNMYQFNIFVKILKMFKNVIILLNKNDIWLGDKNDINAVSLLSMMPNIKIIDKPVVINKIAFLPKVYTVEEQAKTYALLNMSQYMAIVTNDLKSKFAINTNGVMTFSNEHIEGDNIMCITTYSHNVGDNELFAFDVATNSKVINTVHPKIIRVLLEELKSFDYSVVKDNHVIITSDMVFDDVYKRNKAIHAVRERMLKEYGALDVKVDILDYNKCKLHKVSDITTYIRNMTTVDNDTKELLIAELATKFKEED